MTIDDLFDEHGPLSYEKQSRLAGAVGDGSWRFDLQTGFLIFDTFRASVQILGTVSEDSRTWLWAWANDESNIPPSLLTAVSELRRIGTELRISELTEPEIDVERFHNGHALAMIATGLLNGAAYYRGPYEGGAVFLLIPTLPLPTAEDAGNTNLQVTTNFTNFICAYDCDNRAALESYLRQKGYSVIATTPHRILAEHPAEGPVEALFDDAGRLSQFDSQIGGPPPQRKRPWWRLWGSRGSR
jgi:hypothetical protein